MKIFRFPGLIFLFMASTVVGISAHTVSFAVAEIGVPEDFPGTEASSLWENGLLDVFFEAGHIVSNAPIQRYPEGLTEKPLPDETQDFFDEALLGGAQFFILAILDYRGAEELNLKPQQVSIRLFRTKPYGFILEERYSNTKAPDDEFTAAKKAAMRLIPRVRI